MSEILAYLMSVGLSAVYQGPIFSRSIQETDIKQHQYMRIQLSSIWKESKKLTACTD